MTKVPEYNLPKFKPVAYTAQEQVDARYWRYKKQTPPKDTYKPKKTKLIDKHLIGEQIANRNHLRNIKNEL